MQNGNHDTTIAAFWQPFPLMDGRNAAHAPRSERRKVTLSAPQITAPTPLAATDIYETEDVVVVVMDLPGQDAGSLELSFDAGVLTVRAACGEDHAEGRRYLLTERVAAPVERSFALPDSVDPERIEASFDRGVLTVALHKRAQARPRRIEVKSPS
jgi:HSP20 family protein